ncbi:MAG: Holliday junction branch migration protein RuvA [Polyangiaceae bacterium]|nr:Holliday junction branch migration protein RuvA [Polyangiaceae bacterium]
MIGRLTGTIVAEEPEGLVVLDVGGVGYEVLTPIGAVGRARRSADPASPVMLAVHTHVREDALVLYGFADEVERRVFRLLLGVPGVGPKTALGLLSALPPADLAEAVAASDLSRLARVPGIGKKTAERLTLELKEKLPQVGARAAGSRGAPSATGGNRPRLLAALTHMGYRPQEAERAIRDLGPIADDAPLDAALRQALARLTP